MCNLSTLKEIHDPSLKRPQDRVRDHRRIYTRRLRRPCRKTILHPPGGIRHRAGARHEGLAYSLRRLERRHGLYPIIGGGNGGCGGIGNEAAFGLEQRRGLSEGLLRELGTEGMLFGELHARVCGSSPQSPPDDDCEYDESPSAPDRQSSRSTWRDRRQ